MGPRVDPDRHITAITPHRNDPPAAPANRQSNPAMVTRQAAASAPAGRLDRYPIKTPDALSGARSAIRVDRPPHVHRAGHPDPARPPRPACPGSSIPFRSFAAARPPLGTDSPAPTPDCRSLNRDVSEQHSRRPRTAVGQRKADQVVAVSARATTTRLPLAVEPAEPILQAQVTEAAVRCGWPASGVIIVDAPLRGRSFATEFAARTPLSSPHQRNERGRAGSSHGTAGPVASDPSTMSG